VVVVSYIGHGHPFFNTSMLWGQEVIGQIVVNWLKSAQNACLLVVLLIHLNFL